MKTLTKKKLYYIFGKFLPNEIYHSNRWGRVQYIGCCPSRKHKCLVIPLDVKLPQEAKSVVIPKCTLLIPPEKSISVSQPSSFSIELE